MEPAEKSPLTPEAQAIFTMMGAGALLLYRPPSVHPLSDELLDPGESFVAHPAYLHGLDTPPERQPVELRHANELIHASEAGGMWLVCPMSQYNWHVFTGWRRLIGDLGEKFEVYRCYR